MKSKTAAILSSATLIIGALLPWAKVTSFFGQLTISGYEGDGLFTLIIGVILLLDALIRKSFSNFQKYAFIIGGILAGLLSVPKISTLTSATNDYASASIGSGLVLTIVASVIIIIVGFSMSNDEDPESDTSDDPDNWGVELE